MLFSDTKDCNIAKISVDENKKHLMKIKSLKKDLKTDNTIYRMSPINTSLTTSKLSSLITQNSK